jgi:DNA-directed RNA polymerase sigma subunit (sigma70/sigma32)
MADVDQAPPTTEPSSTPAEELARLLADGIEPADLRQQMLDELQDIVEYMKPANAKNKRRIRLYLLLSELGVSNKEIAEYLGVTAESVRQALLKARRGRDGT